jgi:tetratricopeptide (TPR) repeat protein
MEFRILGPLEVEEDGRLLKLGGAQPREAEQLGNRARALDEEFNAAVDGGEQVCRQVLARVHAHRGGLVEAERLAREAVALIDGCQLLNDQCAALWDLADVLAATVRVDEAAAAYQQALEACERKKNLALARQIRERRDSLLSA